MQKESNLSRSQKRESDLEQDEAGVSRVGRVHGGELVELISAKDVRPMYDTECQHINVKIGDSTQFDEVECIDCPMVWVYEYGTIRSNIKEA